MIEYHIIPGFDPDLGCNQVAGQVDNGYAGAMQVGRENEKR